jgi:hypothetical protein
VIAVALAVFSSPTPVPAPPIRSRASNSQGGVEPKTWLSVSFWGRKPMHYCITFRSKSDARITGWYTGNNGRWSTDHIRKKLFDQKEEAEPVAMALRERCPTNAENIKVETQAVADTTPGEE